MRRARPAKKKLKPHGGQPAPGYGNEPEKLVATPDPAVLAELKRRHEETGATMAEMVRRAVKFWIAGTRTAALQADEGTFRKMTRRRGGEATE